MDSFDRAEEARERNEGLHYEEYHESREYLRREDEENGWYEEEEEEDGSNDEEA